MEISAFETKIISQLTDIDLIIGGYYTHAYGGRRRDSGTRVHSMTIEAPITKVINIINGVQESSTISVAQSLDKVTLRHLTALLKLASQFSTK